MVKLSLTNAEKLVRHRLQEQSLSITETARREDHLLIHIVRRGLEMSWDIGGFISKS